MANYSWLDMAAAAVVVGTAVTVWATILKRWGTTTHRITAAIEPGKDGLTAAERQIRLAEDLTDAAAKLEHMEERLHALEAELSGIHASLDTLIRLEQQMKGGG